jgi:hypothetical protein
MTVPFGDQRCIFNNNLRSVGLGTSDPPLAGKPAYVERLEFEEHQLKLEMYGTERFSRYGESAPAFWPMVMPLLGSPKSVV